MSEEIPVYTVVTDYFATGEGHTYCILFTRAYRYGEETDPEVIALEKFAKRFGGWFALGAEVKEGLHFDSEAAKILISPELQKKLRNWNEEAGGFEYHSMIHLNFA